MEFPTQDKTVIIATKGLPYTRTLRAASQISGWAKSPLFSLEFMHSILGELYEEGGYNPDHRPSKEEDERLRRLAFSRFYKAASSQLRLPDMKFNCVVIESLLSSTMELDQLVELSTGNKEEAPFKLIIIEVRLSSKFFWKTIFDFNTSQHWFLPRSWFEVEEAIREYDAKASEWEDKYHLMSSLRINPHLKRLVLDPGLDIREREIVSSANKRKVWSPFGKAIEYLLTDEAAPSVVEYRRWRNEHVQGLLNMTTGASTTTNQQLLCSNSAGDCTFKYTKVPGAVSVNCRACEQQLHTQQEGEDAYMCVSCKLSLHKSCAMFPPVDFYLDVSRYADVFDRVLFRNPEMTLRACKSCSKFSYECGGCLFETHLKCRLLPTVVDIPHVHPHSLSLQFFTDKGDVYPCELCSLEGMNCGYYCVICNFYYHVRCAHSPSQVAHEHGGYRHLMKLILPPTGTSTDDGGDSLAFSGEDYLDQDDQWCVFCYKDLNSQAGFYVCQDCPDYVAHIICISPTWQGFVAPG